MSKRSYSELDYDETDSVSLLLYHAEGLLKAAKALKEEIKASHKSARPHDQIASVLEHSKKIASAAQLLTQDEVNGRFQTKVFLSLANMRYHRQMSPINMSPDLTKF